MTAVAAAMSIPVENLLTPELLRRVAWTPPAEITADSIGSTLEALGARAWQIEATAPVIAEAFVESAHDPDPADETQFVGRVTIGAARPTGALGSTQGLRHRRQCGREN